MTAKLALAALVVTTASASAEAVKKAPPAPPPIKDSPAEKTGRAFLKTAIETSEVLGMTKSGIQYFLSIRDGLKGCEGVAKAGTAKSTADGAKLKTCIASAYTAIGQGGAVAKIGVAEVEMDKFVGHFAKADQKKMRDLTVGTKIVESNLSGDGESLRISLSVHPTNGVIAVWLDAEAVE